MGVTPFWAIEVVYYRTGTQMVYEITAVNSHTFDNFTTTVRKNKPPGCSPMATKSAVLQPSEWPTEVKDEIERIKSWSPKRRWWRWRCF